jgi:transposase
MGCPASRNRATPVNGAWARSGRSTAKTSADAVPPDDVVLLRIGQAVLASYGIVTAAVAELEFWRIFSTMTKISYAGYRFPPEIIQQAIWLYLRFTLSFRDVEDLLAERDITVSYETVRRWVNHFGPKIAADLRKRRPKPHTTWHLDEVYLKIDGRMIYLWRAVDGEGEVLDVLVQTRRNKRAALKLMRKLLKKLGIPFTPPPPFWSIIKRGIVGNFHKVQQKVSSPLCRGIPIPL